MDTQSQAPEAASGPAPQAGAPTAPEDVPAASGSAAVDDPATTPEQKPAEPVASSTLPAVTSPASTVPALVLTRGSDRWPNAYARRSFKLGMRLAEFRAMPFPDLSAHPSAHAVCDKDAEAKSNTFVSLYNPLESFGAIECKFFAPNTYTSIMGSVPLIFGSSNPFEDEFYFVADESGDFRLFSIVTSGYTLNFYGLAADFQTKLGKPTSDKLSSIQNKIGNTFTNETIIYENDVSRIELVRYYGDLNTYGATFTLKPLQAKIDAARTAKSNEDAQRL